MKKTEWTSLRSNTINTDERGHISLKGTQKSNLYKFNIYYRLIVLFVFFYNQGFVTFLRRDVGVMNSEWWDKGRV